MKKIYFAFQLIIAFVLITKITFAQTPCQKPFFSEFNYGTGFNKALEIFNPDVNPKNLNNYKLKLVEFGTNNQIIIPLNGTIAPKQTFVVTSQYASPYLQQVSAMEVSTTILQNPIELSLLDENNTVIDKIGSNDLEEWIRLPLENFIQRNIFRNYNVQTGEPNWQIGQEQWWTMLNYQYQNLGQHINVCSPSTDTITYRYSNIKELTDTITSVHYLQMDVEVKCNSDSTFLTYAEFSLKYDTTIFSNDPFNQVNGINHLVKTNFLEFENYGGQNLVDIQNQKINIKIFYSNIISPRVQLDTNFKKLCRLKWIIEPQFCNSTVSFFPQTPSNVSKYTLANNVAIGTGSIDYSMNELPSPISINLCSINITDFNPNIIRAGVGDTLTIIGYGFNIPNFGIKFKDTDYGGFSNTDTLNTGDYISRSDTLIKIKLPSEIINSNGVKTRLGTGPLIASYSNNGIDSNIETINPLIIKHSTEQRAFGNNIGEKPYTILQKTDTNAYIIRCDSSIYQLQGAKQAVIKAIEDWRCFTNVNIRLGTDTSIIDNVNLDNTMYSFIRLRNDTSLIFDSAYALTRSNYTNCNLYNGRKNFSIRLLKNLSLISDGSSQDTLWLTNPTGDKPANYVDFYEVILHEIGHGLGLYHITDVLDLMYYTSLFTDAFQPYSYRKNLSQSPNPVLCETDLVAFSISNSVGCDYFSMEEIPECPGTMFGFNENVVNNEVSIYPNPTNNFFNVICTNTISNISIFDSKGSFVLEENCNSSNKMIDVNNLTNGLYFIIIKTNENVITKKLIKY
jgi:hypothetical protein